MAQIARNLQTVQSQIGEAALAVGRAADSVRLVAVSKTMPADIVRFAYEAGQRIFGENRVQDLYGKVSELPDDCEWHFIGPLQKNKVRPAVQVADWLHTLDSVALVERVERIATGENRRLKVLVQVNVSGEESKHGCTMADAEGVVRAALKSSRLECVGLMTIPPYMAPDDELRGIFRQLRELRDSLESSTGARLPELSMGMSGDFRVAIEEGATLVRIGTAIFGARNY